MDIHAQNFITATGISNPTIENAIDNLCIYLKKWGVWNRLIALYPMVGGTADTHKYNLKDAANTDAAKRLTFSGGWTHSANGALPNGTTGYADTHIDLNQDTTPYSFHVSYYSRTNSIGADDYVIAGVKGAGPPFYIDLYSNNRIFIAVGEAPSNTLVINPASGFNKLLVLNSIKPTKYSFYRDAVEMASDISTRHNNYLPNKDPYNPRTLYIGAQNNNGAPSLFSAIECAFFSVGLGLTEEEIKLLNNAVADFQTALSRNV